MQRAYNNEISWIKKIFAFCNQMLKLIFHIPIKNLEKPHSRNPPASYIRNLSSLSHKNKVRACTVLGLADRKKISPLQT
jgi:hypothetical protein